MEVRLVKKDSGASQYEIKGKYLSCPSKSHYRIIHERIHFLLIPLALLA